MLCVLFGWTRFGVRELADPGRSTGAGEGTDGRTERSLLSTARAGVRMDGSFFLASASEIFRCPSQAKPSRTSVRPSARMLARVARHADDRGWVNWFAGGDAVCQWLMLNPESVQTRSTSDRMPHAACLLPRRAKSRVLFSAQHGAPAFGILACAARRGPYPRLLIVAA